ncbi:MAG TPA: sensor domain-containing diguanylate cyclase [Actinomycetota bacterium]|nr:sensor domain-containing diguanylate cyclase [Actinomycetota bacterium]
MSESAAGAPIPVNDQDRVDNLRSYAVLDTEPEEAFDRITRLVSALLDMPIALVSLVDGERQWFKSRVGLAAAETPRELAFCGYAILDDVVFTVTDAARDDRFADNPLVIGDPNIRFYAGAPLTTREGFNVGTLCVIDRKPRTLDAGQVSILRDFAALALRELELHKAAALDGLTGVFNRSGLTAAGQSEVGRARRQGSPLSLAIIDVDHFKDINDTYGHAGGDIALRRVSMVCQSVVRGQDVVGRLGGDEFGVLLPGADAAAAGTVAHRIAAEVRSNELLPAEDRPAITLSIGVASLDAKEPDLTAAWARADSALYQAKETRDAVVIHGPLPSPGD